LHTVLQTGIVPSFVKVVLHDIRGWSRCDALFIPLVALLAEKKIGEVYTNNGLENLQQSSNVSLRVIASAAD